MRRQEARSGKPAEVVQAASAVDAVTHKIACADLSLSNVTNAQALPELMSQSDRRVKEALVDEAYDVHNSHDSLKKRGINAVIPLRSVAKDWLLRATWSEIRE